MCLKLKNLLVRKAGRCIEVARLVAEPVVEDLWPCASWEKKCDLFRTLTLEFLITGWSFIACLTGSLEDWHRWSLPEKSAVANDESRSKEKRLAPAAGLFGIAGADVPGDSVRVGLVEAGYAFLPYSNGVDAMSVEA